jgi:hypothetical protein
LRAGDSVVTAAAIAPCKTTAIQLFDLVFIDGNKEQHACRCVGCPILPMRLESAELCKIAINCCLILHQHFVAAAGDMF